MAGEVVPGAIIGSFKRQIKAFFYFKVVLFFLAADVGDFNIGYFSDPTIPALGGSTGFSLDYAQIPCAA